MSALWNERPQCCALLEMESSGFSEVKRQEKTIAIEEENYHEEWTITSFTELTHASLDTSEFMNMISTSKVIIKKAINNLDFDKLMKS